MATRQGSAIFNVQSSAGLSHVQSTAGGMSNVGSIPMFFDPAVGGGGEERCWTTRSPFAHVVCGRQNPFPASGWKLSAGHASHTAAYSVLEKWPIAQLVHALPSMKVPGMHVPQ